MGINTAYRASELLSIRVGHVAHLLPGDRLEVKQKKTKQYRSVTFNQAAYAVQIWLKAREDLSIKKNNTSLVHEDAYLFDGSRGPDEIKV